MKTNPQNRGKKSHHPKTALAALACLALLLASCAEVQNLRLIKQAQDERIAELEVELDKVNENQIDTIRTLRNQTDSFKSQLENTRAELRKAQTQRTQREMALEKTVSQTQLDLDRKIRELNQAAELLEIKDNNLASGSDRISSLTQSILIQENDFAQLSRELEQAKTTHQDLAAASEAEKKQNFDEINRLKTEIENTGDATANLLTTLDDRNKGLVDRDKKIAELQKKITEETQRAGQLETNVKSLHASLEKVQETIRNADAGASENKAVAQQRLALEKEIMRFKGQIAKLEKGETVMDADLEDALNLFKISLKPLDDADFATVATDSRGVVVRISADFLFKPGSITLDTQVLATLDQIAEILAKYPNKYIEVQGHTDSSPIVNLPFVDNWSLASARADRIVRHFVDHGKIDPRRLKSVSCAQFRPPESGSPKARKMLRRVEIILTPNP